MTCYRPTTLKLASAHCPRAIDFYEENRFQFRDHFATGIAAHDCLAEVGLLARHLKRSPELDEMVRVCDAAVERLTTYGREFDGEREPPMPMEDATEGRDLALRWAMEHPLSPTAEYERGLAFTEDWKVIGYGRCDGRFRLILDVQDEIEDGGEEYVGRLALCRDYKSSWAADAEELKTWQMRGQAVAVWELAKHEGREVDGVRREIVNLRTGQTYAEDLWLEQGGRDQLEDWKQQITRYMNALDKMRGADGKRPARVGAGCNGCAWSLMCPDLLAALPANQDLHLLQPEAVAQNLAAVDAWKDALTKIAKGLWADGPHRDQSTEVGWAPDPKREPKADAARLAWEWWKKEGGEIEGFLTALKPSVSSLEVVAELLIKKGAAVIDGPPEDGENEPDQKLLHLIDMKAAESLVNQWTQVKTGRRFGVRRVKGAA